MKRVIVISGKNKACIEWDVETLADMQKIVGGRIEPVCLLPNGDEVYANEEANFDEDKRGFIIVAMVRGSVGMVRVLGNAFVIGAIDEKGDSTSAISSFETVVQSVIFSDWSRS